MDLMTRRRALLARVESGGRLPVEYQEVEYIEGLGAQYIDALFSFSSNENARLKFKVNVTTIADRRFFGYYISNTGALSSWNIFVIQSRPTYNFEIGNLRISGIIASAQVDYDIDINIVNRELYINGVDKGEMVANINGSSVYIFGTKWSGFRASRDAAIAKLYYLEAYDNGVKIADFIPCYRKSDSKPGMYDLVTNTFFVNAGEGEFLYGADVN